MKFLLFSFVILFFGCSLKKKNPSSSDEEAEETMTYRERNYGQSVVVTADGTIYTAGVYDWDYVNSDLTVISSYGYRGVVRKSTDQGQTWTTAYSTRSSCVGVTLFSDVNSENTIYLMDFDSIRKSRDGGSSWEVLSFGYTIPYPTLVENIAGRGGAVDSDGNIYITAEVHYEPNNEHWMTWKSVDQGVNWELIDNYQYVARYRNWTHGLAINSEKHIFVVGGVAEDQSDVAWDKFSWVVRRSTDGGASFSNVDFYNGSSGEESCDTGNISIAPNDDVYVAGWCSNGSAGSHWVVKRSSDGGDNWIVLDDYSEMVSGSDATYASDVMIDSEDPSTIYVAGYGMKYDFRYYWILRKSSDGGVHWSNIDEYQYEYEERVENTTNFDLFAFPRKMAMQNGNLYLTGEESRGVSNPSYWVTRASLNGGETFETVDQFRYGEQL